MYQSLHLLVEWVLLMWIAFLELRSKPEGFIFSEHHQKIDSSSWGYIEHIIQLLSAESHYYTFGSSIYSLIVGITS